MLMTKGVMKNEKACKDLVPEEKRGEANTSLNLKYIIKKIAEELNLTEEEMTKITTKNAQELFKI